MNTDFQTLVQQRLKNIPVNKERELYDLLEDLGYDYENEIYDSFFSDWTDNQKALKNQITLLGRHGDFYIFWVHLNNTKLHYCPVKIEPVAAQVPWPS